MKAVIGREVKGMKEIAAQEENLTLQWRGNIGELAKVRLKNIRVMEMWHNKQVTRENVQEITTLNTTKNGKSLALEIHPGKSIYVKSNLDGINVPVSFIKTPTDRGVFEEIFGETLRA